MTLSASGHLNDNTSTFSQGRRTRCDEGQAGMPTRECAFIYKKIEFWITKAEE
jgi:hypothetical protein